MPIFSPDDYAVMGYAQGPVFSTDTLHALAALEPLEVFPLLSYPSYRKDFVAFLARQRDGSRFGVHELVREVGRIVRRPVRIFRNGDFHREDPDA